MALRSISATTIARIAQRSGANAVDHDRLSHEAPTSLANSRAPPMTIPAVAAPAHSVDMPATEKYPETLAKEVAARNVAALVMRAPECAVEAAMCPAVRETGSDASDGASCIGGCTTA